MKSFVLIPLITLIALGIPASSEARAHLGVHIGMQKAQGADDASTLYGALIRSKDQGWAFEASIDYRQEKFDDGDITVKTWPVMLTVMFYPIPFLHADVGAGWFNTTFDYSKELEDAGAKDETAQRFGWHFGGGAEFPLSTVILTADIRYVFLDYKWNYVPGSEGRKGDFYMITAGMLFGKD